MRQKYKGQIVYRLWACPKLPQTQLLTDLWTYRVKDWCLIVLAEIASPSLSNWLGFEYYSIRDLVNSGMIALLELIVNVNADDVYKSPHIVVIAKRSPELYATAVGVHTHVCEREFIYQLLATSLAAYLTAISGRKI